LKRLLFGVLMLSLAACSQTGGDTSGTAATETTATETTASTASTETTQTQTAAAPTTSQPAQEGNMSTTDQVAILHTTAGDITIRFFPDVAPNHVANFINLSKSGFYNGTKFHRVIPGFMIQGGDPNTKSGNPATWGTGGSDQMIRQEFNKVSHKRGIVSMARSQDPNSASSQFFIVVADSTFLDNNYTVFGQVLSGMDVADKIVSAQTAGERPTNPVAITSVELRPATDAEKGPAPK
jgi:cyclophilin family peptidyl-prolyl cis-trans isomerase